MRTRIIIPFTCLAVLAVGESLTVDVGPDIDLSDAADCDDMEIHSQTYRALGLARGDFTAQVNLFDSPARTTLTVTNNSGFIWPAGTAMWLHMGVASDSDRAARERLALADTAQAEQDTADPGDVPEVAETAPESDATDEAGQTGEPAPEIPAETPQDVAAQEPAGATEDTADPGDAAGATEEPAQGGQDTAEAGE